MNRVLVFGDTHIPFIRNNYLEFLKETYRKYKCNRVVCVGDLFDFHRISRHDSHPDAMGAKEEYLKGLEIAKKFYKAFPKVLICIGNHDARMYRQVAKEGVPEAMLPSYKDLFNTPVGWKWSLRHTVDGVLYKHGNRSGEYPHVSTAKAARMSTVTGHTHAVGGVHYMAGPEDLIFAMCCGCGMDSNSYAAQYAQEYDKKPIVGCGIVLGGKQAIFVPMDLGTRRLTV